MKNKTIFFILSLLMVAISSCNRDKNNPGYAYMADYDMYFSKYDKAYDASTILPNGQVNQPAPEGAVARKSSYYPYHPKGVVERMADQVKAGKELDNPLKATKENIAEGKRQFEIFCSDCHGFDAKGNGHLYKEKLFPAKPSDLTGSHVQEMPDGSIFFVITEGSASGLMGSHGTQVTPENRWKIVDYLRSIVK